MSMPFMQLQMNAFGRTASPKEVIGQNASAWTRSPLRASLGPDLWPSAVARTRWWDPRIGWGLVTGKGIELPPILKELVRSRSRAPVFEYRAGPG